MILICPDLRMSNFQTHYKIQILLVVADLDNSLGNQHHLRSTTCRNNTMNIQAEKKEAAQREQRAIENLLCPAKDRYNHLEVKGDTQTRL